MASKDLMGSSSSVHHDTESFVSLTRQALTVPPNSSDHSRPTPAQLQLKRRLLAARNVQLAINQSGKAVELDKLVTRVEECLLVKEECCRLSIELDFLVSDLRQFSELVSNTDLTENQVFYNLFK